MNQVTSHHRFKFFLLLDLCFSGFLIIFIIGQLVSLPKASASTANASVFPTSNLPVQFSYLTGPYFLGVNTCSPVITIQAEDSLENSLSAANDAKVQLLTNNSNLHFYLDAACKSLIQSIVIPANKGQASFYIESAKAGWGTIAASSTGIALQPQSESFEGVPTGVAPTSPNLLK